MYQLYQLNKPVFTGIFRAGKLMNPQEKLRATLPQIVLMYCTCPDVAHQEKGATDYMWCEMDKRPPYNMEPKQLIRLSNVDP